MNSKINWGNIVNTGFKWVQDQLQKKTTGPVAKSSTAETTPGQTLPVWVWPVAILGLLFLLKKKKR